MHEHLQLIAYAGPYSTITVLTYAEELLAFSIPVFAAPGKTVPPTNDQQQRPSARRLGIPPRALNRAVTVRFPMAGLLFP